MNVGQMLSKHLVAAVLLIIVIALGTGIYFTTKEKPEAQPLPTQLTVVPSESTISAGDNFVTLTATLASNGAPIEGENISWSVYPEVWGFIFPKSSITNSSGKASVKFRIVSPYSVWPPENVWLYTITASFAGGNRYRGSNGSTSIEVKLPHDLSLETISHETYGRYENHEYLVIENSGEWEKVWLLARGSEAYPIPEVDFSSHAVIAVFMGGRSSGGYHISIERITNVGNKIIVSVKETYPGRGIIVTDAFTSPHHIIKVERVQKPIVFEVQQFLVHAHDENWNPYDEIMYELVGEHHVEAGSGPPGP